MAAQDLREAFKAMPAPLEPGAQPSMEHLSQFVSGLRAWAELGYDPADPSVTPSNRDVANALATWITVHHGNATPGLIKRNEGRIEPLVPIVLRAAASTAIKYSDQPGFPELRQDILRLYEYSTVEPPKSSAQSRAETGWRHAKLRKRLLAAVVGGEPQ